MLIDLIPQYPSPNLIKPMAQLRKFSDIIERIEHLRNLLKHNKSRFSMEIGMKPQTYNNFIGSQGSKPSVELILGIVNKFGANPNWLLNGTGPVFTDETKSEAILDQQDRAERSGETGAVGEARTPYTARTVPQDVEHLQAEIEAMEPLLQRVEMHIQQVEQQQLPIIERYLGLMRRYFELDPVAALEEFREMLNRIRQRASSR